MTTSYAHCITGRPPNRVLHRGAPLARGDTIAHRDGTLWRYEAMSQNNSAILAFPLPGPGPMQSFSMAAFGITIRLGAGAAEESLCARRIA